MHLSIYIFFSIKSYTCMFELTFLIFTYLYLTEYPIIWNIDCSYIFDFVWQALQYVAIDLYSFSELCYKHSPSLSSDK